MTELIREALAPFIGLAVHFLLSRVERRGCKQGYEDAMNDRRPKHRPQIGIRTKDIEK